jgi:DNA-binding transcriptional MerR regulator
MKKVYSLGEVAKLLGVAPHRIVYRHTSGQSPEPKRVFGKRAYCWQDVEALAEHLGIQVNVEQVGGKGNG